MECANGQAWKRAMVAAWLMLAMVSMAGCVTATDPVTGEKTYAVDPNSGVVKVVETAAAAAEVAAPFVAGPWGLLLTAIAGAGAAWLKVKPSLTTAKAKAEHYYAATASVVTAIEEFKKQAPDAWTKLETAINEQLTKQNVDPKTIENVIRAIRGLPEKA